MQSRSSVRLSSPASTSPPWLQFSEPSRLLPPPATSSAALSLPTACSKCSRPAEPKKYEPDGRQRYCDRSRIYHRDCAVYFVTEVAKFADHRPPRRLRR